MNRSEFRVQSSEFRVQSSEFRVRVSGFTPPVLFTHIHTHMLVRVGSRDHHPIHIVCRHLTMAVSLSLSGLARLTTKLHSVLRHALVWKERQFVVSKRSNFLAGSTCINTSNSTGLSSDSIYSRDDMNERNSSSLLSLMNSNYYFSSLVYIHPTVSWMEMIIGTNTGINSWSGVDEDEEEEEEDFGIWNSSTLKKRRKKMNKHKLKKRRKRERAKANKKNA